MITLYSSRRLLVGKEVPTQDPVAKQKIKTLLKEKRGGRKQGNFFPIFQW
jgi:hypothetical protein